MKLKTFKTARVLVAATLGALFSQAVIYRNFVIPIVAAVVGLMVMLILRRRVTEIIADERDYANAGRAALLAMQIYSWVVVIIIVALFATRDANPTFEPIASALAYSACFLTLTYTLVYKYHDRFKPVKAKFLFIALAGAVILGAVVVGLRLFSGEDGWICKNGQWVKHGQPSFPAPQTQCE